MSDPVANVDIEDVLSSIRRLVSNEPEKDGGAPRETPEGERLVLTPSQRVDDEDPARGDARAPADTATAGATGVTEAHPPEIGLPTGSGPDHAPDDAAEVDGDETRDETLDEAGDETRDEAGAGLSAEAEAEGEAALAALSLDWPEAADVARTDTEEPARPEAAAGHAARDGSGPDALAAQRDPDLEGIAAMFARHGPTAPTTWEPDGDDEDAFAGGVSSGTLDWRDPGEAEGRHAPGKAGQDHTADSVRRAESRVPGAGHEDGAHREAENTFAAEGEAVLDEAALRDLVAEIVREELMGTLGERITRNVRKLVRREIHRALNSQDFD